MDDAVVVQVLHPGQDGTGEKTKPISLSLLSLVEEQLTVPKHGYGISFSGMAALTEGVVQIHPRTNREGHGDSHHLKRAALPSAQGMASSPPRFFSTECLGYP